MTILKMKTFKSEHMSTALSTQSSIQRNLKKKQKQSVSI